MNREIYKGSRMNSFNFSEPSDEIILLPFTWFNYCDYNTGWTNINYDSNWICELIKVSQIH